MFDLSGLLPPFNASEYCLMATVLIAVVTDCAEQKIFNWLTFPAMLLGLVLHACLGGLWGLGDSLLGFLCGFVPVLPVYARGGLKGGDVKLFAAIGALGGTCFALAALLASAIAGGVLSVLWALMHGQLRNTMGQVGQAVRVAMVPGLQLTRPLHESHTPPLPYGVAITTGTLVCLLMPSFRPF